MNLTNREIYRLGLAVGSFSVGEIDQGIHVVLPTKSADGLETDNDVFGDLCHYYFLAINASKCAPENVGMLYIGAVMAWARYHHIDDVIDMHESAETMYNAHRSNRNG